MQHTTKIMGLAVSLLSISSLYSMDKYSMERLTIGLCADIDGVLNAEPINEYIEMYIMRRKDFLKSKKQDSSLSNKDELLLFNAVQWIIERTKYYQNRMQRCIEGSKEQWPDESHSHLYKKLEIIINLKSELEKLEWPSHLKKAIQKHMLTGAVEPKEFVGMLQKQEKEQKEYLSGICFKQD